MLTKIFYQQHDIAGSLSERRQDKLNHIETIVEIFTKLACGYRLQQIFISGRQYSDINKMGLLSTHLLKLTGNQYPQ